MKRIVMVLTVALVMAAMVVATAAPVFAHAGGIGVAHEAIPEGVPAHELLPDLH